MFLVSAIQSTHSSSIWCWHQNKYSWTKVEPFCLFLKCKGGLESQPSSGEHALRVRENPDLSPSTQMAAHSHLWVQSRGPNTHLWPLRALSIHTVHMHTRGGRPEANIGCLTFSVTFWDNFFMSLESTSRLNLLASKLLGSTCLHPSCFPC